MRKLKSASLLLLLTIALHGCFSSSGSSTDVSITPTPTPITPTPTPVHTPTMPVEVLKAFGSDPTKADTDEDGLLDEFEIKHGYPFTKPDSKDTDENGTTDDNEDLDKDGLTQVQEQGYKTDPLNKDSDSDDLSDYDEIVTYKTNPLSNDTDGDGMYDGREIANKTDPLIADADKVITSINTATVIEPDTKKELKISVSLTGVGDLSKSLDIKAGSEDQIGGQIGKQYDITFPEADLSKMQSATVTLPLDSTDPKAVDPTKLFIATINPKTKLWELLPSTVDLVNNTITAQTTHFSLYTAVSQDDYIARRKNLQQTCDKVTDPDANPADVALVIDSSGSMGWNDPQNIRLSAAKTFISAMKTTDRVSVVDFDDSSRLALGMSSDKTALSQAVDTIDSSGGTNIGAGVSLALQQFQGGDKTKIRAILLLTDGDGDYDTSLTNQLQNQGIRVFTIGLTGSVNTTLLTSIADATGGKYKQINDPNGLTGIFKEFASVFGDDGKDTDGDTLTDCQELQGIYDSRIDRVITTDPNKADTDGDRIPDNDEFGEVKKEYLILGIDNGVTPAFTISAWSAHSSSNPLTKSSDFDELEDADEIDLGTNPIHHDSDIDLVNDDNEIAYGTNPNNKDTDGDGYQDDEEINNLTELNPLIYDEKISKWDYAWQCGVAYAVADIVDIDTNIEITCSILAALTPGLGDAQAVTNIIANGIRGDAVSVGIDVVGLAATGTYAFCPTGVGCAAAISANIAANAAKVTRILSKGIKAFPTKTQLLELSKQVKNLTDDAARSVVIKLLQSDYPNLYNKLITNNIDELSIAKFAKGAKGLQNFTELLDGAADVRKIKTSFIDTSKYINAGFEAGFFTGKNGWRLAEDVIREGRPRPPHGLKSGLNGTRVDRFPDDIDDKFNMAEAKTGFQVLNPKIIHQIEKDAALIKSKKARSATWHFFPSGITHSIGADLWVLKVLKDNNIPYIIHLP